MFKSSIQRFEKYLIIDKVRFVKIILVKLSVYYLIELKCYHLKPLKMATY